MTIYTTRQAALEAGVSHATANRHAKRRNMPRIGDQFAIPENRYAAFVEFLKTRRGNKVPLGKGQTQPLPTDLEKQLSPNLTRRLAGLGNLINAIEKRRRRDETKR